MADGPATSPLPLCLDDLAAAYAAVLRGPSTGLVLAVSGGPDSICLMGMTARLASRMPPLTIATVDHGLRAASAGEADAVIAAAGALGLPARRLVWTGPKPDRAIQERARAARYALLAACCADVGADGLVTAHTRDDQAETVLFRLLRGSGPAGLSAMRPASPLGDRLVQLRPLLRFDKARLTATCVAEGWPYATDPSNADPRFARPRLRRLRPLLDAQGLDTAALERLADRAARAEEALAETAAELAREMLTGSGPNTVDIDMGRLSAKPAELVLRLLAMAVAPLGHAGPIRLDRLERAAKALREAARQGSPLTLTLHGTILRLSPHGCLAVRQEGERRRGTGAPSVRETAVKHNGTASLGKGGRDPYIAP